MRFYEQFYGFHALRTVGKCTSRHLFRYGGLFLDTSTGLLLFSPSQLLTRPNRKITHHFYVKRQTRICTAWPSFLFTCRLLLIISTPKLVISRNFSSIRIVLSRFYPLIFYFEKFSTWIWRLPFAVYVKLKLSNDSAIGAWQSFNRREMTLIWATWPSSAPALRQYQT